MATITRVLAAHPQSMAALAVALAAFLLLPGRLGLAEHLVLAWDAGALLLLLLMLVGFARTAESPAMAANAERQQDGEWTIFAITVAGAAASFAALSSMLGHAKDVPPGRRDLYVALVAFTLLLSWTLTHILFAVRYAHEYYSATEGVARPGVAGHVDGGLAFPGEDAPDYWDFVYFGIVLGMTFQVSDVQITSRKLRRLATVHGLVGFLFNTVIVALTVNIAASLLG